VSICGLSAASKLFLRNCFTGVANPLSVAAASKLFLRGLIGVANPLSVAVSLWLLKLLRRDFSGSGVVGLRSGEGEIAACRDVPLYAIAVN